MADEIEVWRGGVSSDHITQVRAPDAALYPGYPHAGKTAKSGGMEVVVYLPSKGGGTTGVKVWIPPSQFDRLASVMIEGSPEAAENAFLRAMLVRRHPTAKGS